MPTNDPSNTAMPLDEQLVAYLDGELDAESSRRIEELLATDPEARRRLQVMERTWEMLDDLDESPVEGKFTQTTLEMVAVAARSDVEESLAQAPGRRRRRVWIIGGSLLAALLAGFLTVALRATISNRQLLADLPVLENFDDYRQVESVEFLRLLDKEKLFPGEGDEAPHETALKPEIPVPQRREHVEKLSPADKEELVQAEERFTALDREHQQELRALHAAIEADADAEHLRRVVQRYCDWAKGLSYSSRAELAELGPADRIEWIEKRFKEESAREGGRRLGGKDTDAFWKWMNECAAEHAEQYLDTLPDTGRKRLAELGPAMRHLAFIQATWPPQQQPPAAGRPPLLTDGDLARLLAELSPELRSRLEKLTPPEQWRTVAACVRQVLRRQMMARSLRSPLSKDNDERLADFFEQLPPDQRDRLLALPGEEMERALLQLYLRQTRTPDGAGVRPDGPKGRRPGGPGGKRTTPDKNGKESPAGGP